MPETKDRPPAVFPFSKQGHAPDVPVYTGAIAINQTTIFRRITYLSSVRLYRMASIRVTLPTSPMWAVIMQSPTMAVSPILKRGPSVLALLGMGILATVGYARLCRSIGGCIQGGLSQSDSILAGVTEIKWRAIAPGKTGRYLDALVTLLCGVFCC